MAEARAIRRRKCTQCGYEGDEEAFFRSNNGPKASWQARLPGYVPRRPVCIGCELTARNDPTPEARALRKARNSISQHAAKWNMRPKDFSAMFGWQPQRMAHDVLHAFDNTCAYCWFPYSKMGHGLEDVTVDIIDPDKYPYYHTNVQLCCGTCNSAKAKTSPELWARRLIEFRQRAAWLAKNPDNPADSVDALPLFAAAGRAAEPVAEAGGRRMDEETEAVLEREKAAYELFGSRWEVSALQATDPELFDRLVEQERLYCEAQDEGDAETIVLHGEAMIRGWQAALKRMEDAEIAKALRLWPGAKVIAIRPKPGAG